MARYLALDVGSQTVGLALADDADGLVQALYTLTRISRKRDIAELADEAERQDVDVLVVGLPKHRDGSESDSAKRARRIGELLSEASGLPVIFHDEYLSTFEAEERLRARGYSGEPLRSRLDAEAAKVILEDYLARE